MENQELRSQLVKSVRESLKLDASTHLDIKVENLINEVINDTMATTYALPLMTELVVMSYKIYKTNLERVEQANQKATLDYWQAKLSELLNNSKKYLG